MMGRIPKGLNIIKRKIGPTSPDILTVVAIPIRAISHKIIQLIMVHLNNSIAYRCITFSCLYPVSVVCNLLLSIFVSLWIVTHSLAGHPQFGHAFNVSSLNNCPHSVHFTCAIIMNSGPNMQKVGWKML